MKDKFEVSVAELIKTNLIISSRLSPAISKCKEINVIFTHSTFFIKEEYKWFTSGFSAETPIVYERREKLCQVTLPR